MNLSRFRPTSQSMPLWLQQVLDRLMTNLSLLLGWQLDSVENVAGLTAVNDTRIPDGSKKLVRTLWDTFTLDQASTQVVDGITVVATASGTGRWLRDRQPNEVWGKQGTFYVDPLTGDDENTGLTQGEALATFAEVRRRLEPVGLLVPTTIYIVSDLDSSDPIGMNTGGEQLTIEGIPTVVYSGTVNTYSQAGNEIGDLNDAGWTVADYLPPNNYGHILFTSGPANGYGCWILQDLGGGSARVSNVIDQVFSFPAEATPNPGDSFEVHDLPHVTYERRVSFGGEIRIHNIASDFVDFDDLVTIESPWLRLLSCRASVYAIGSVLNVYDCIFNGSGQVTYMYGGASGNMFASTGFSFAAFRSPVVLASLYEFPTLFMSDASIDLQSDLYLYGDFGSRSIRITNGGQLNMGPFQIRGDIAGTTRLMDLETNCMFEQTAASNSIVEQTVRFADDGNIEIELDTESPIYNPATQTQVKTGATSGAIGTVKAGIKGNLTAVAGTYYALSDLTESATDIMPYVATNRSFARNLRVSLEGDLGADTLDVTVLVDGVDSGIKVTGITGNIPHEYSDVANTALVAPGQKVSFEIERTGTAGTATNIVCTLECG